jgi:hypothetical protein
MNCLEYRRELLAGNPERSGMQAHRMQCAQCTAFRAEHLALERDLRDALEVPVPRALEARLIEQVLSVPARPMHSASRRRWLVAAAAGLGSALIAGPYLWTTRDDPLALACIQWVIKEEAKSIMMGAMPRHEAQRVLADTLPLARIEQLGQIRHVAPCPFGDSTAYHVVLSRGDDKISLLVMPDRRVTRAMRAFHESLFATVVAVGSGSVGIVGPSKASISGVVAQLHSNA